MTTGLYDFFPGPQVQVADQPYRKIGYPRNPFLPADGAGVGEPFYTVHIAEALAQLTGWVRTVHEQQRRLAASLVGNVGAGKTRIIERLSGGVRKWPGSERAFAYSVHLSQSGYSRTSVGALLLGAFETSMEDIIDSAMPRRPSTDIFPIIWAIAHSQDFPSRVEGPVANALLRARKSEQERVQLCVDISMWLRRQHLTPTRVRISGLTRSIDWEGELIPILADLLRFAAECRLLRTLFFFVDQIEDLFTPSFTQIRRARLLTDLRALVDQADAGAPIGILLAWAPESDESLAKKYEALSNRLRRFRVELPLLRREDAGGFAHVWVQAMAAEPGYEPKMQPRVDDLAGTAWTRLRQQGVLLPPERTTPRELLRALAEEVDRRVGLRAI